MNKFGIVIGAAAVVTLAGCKDPNYKYATAPSSQNEVKSAATVAAKPVEPVVKLEKPVEAKPIAIENRAPIAPVVPVAAAKPKSRPSEDYTIYIVQNGDFLAKVSKKFNVTVSSIKRLNPSIKKDIIRVGQKLKLPGKIDVGVQKEPVKRAAQPKGKLSAKKAAAVYTGATKEYAVKNGDTLGSIAYGNGITIRQLKAMNKLSSNALKIGQKLKIPAEKVVSSSKKAAGASAAAKGNAAPAAEKQVAEKNVAAPAEGAATPTVEPTAETKPEAAPAAATDAAAPVAAEESKPAAPATTTYVVQEGDDITGVSLRWGISAAQIRELNNLAEGDQLVKGQIIKLPADAVQQ